MLCRASTTVTYIIIRVTTQTFRSIRQRHSLINASPPPALTDAGKNLIPRQFAFDRSPSDLALQPQIIFQNDGTILYRFKPNAVARGRFEKMGGGDGYVWGAGSGLFEYVVPERKDRRKVGS